MKAQRITSARFICVRAPMINAPITAMRISPYIASAVRRVIIHMNISKLSPRLVRGRVLDFVVAMSTSQRRMNDHEDGQTINGQKDRPFDPDGFARMFE